MRTESSPSGPAGVATAEPPVTLGRFLTLFSAVMLPMFLAAVEQTLVATATPAIVGEIGGLRDASWIAIAYLLAAATVVPLYGRLGDRHGRRRLLFVALGVFAAGSLCCGLAQSLPQLAAARVLQGLGGGGLMTLSQALIGELVPPRERPRFQGWFAMVFTAASVGGPVLGGFVSEHLGWRWLFLGSLPLAAFAAWRLWRLPASGPNPAVTGAQDVPGLALFVMTVVPGLWWLSSGGHRFTWNSPLSLMLAAWTGAALWLLIRRERRHPAPFLPVELLRLQPIRQAALTTLVFASCLFAMVFFLPVYLQIARGTSASSAGLLLLPLTLGLVSGATLTGRIVARTHRPGTPPVVGLMVAATAVAALALVSPQPRTIAGLCFVAGLGFGSVMPTTQLIVQIVAGRERLGAATSIVSLARSLGGALGTALFGAVAFALLPPELVPQPGASAPTASGPAVAEAARQAFDPAFLLIAGLALVGAWTASRVKGVRLE